MTTVNLPKPQLYLYLQIAIRQRKRELTNFRAKYPHTHPLIEDIQQEIKDLAQAMETMDDKK